MGGMSEEKGSARPRQVTMAAVMGVISSLLLVLGLFDTLDRLRTPAMRDVVDEFLADPPGSSLGLGTAQVIDLMRVLAFASGALAAMALVFAVFVLQRHRGARIGFTVVSVLLLLTIPVAGLMPFLLAVAALQQWSPPARDWYAGRVPVTAPAGGRPTMPSLSQHDPRAGGSTRADLWSAPASDDKQEQPMDGSTTPPQDQQHNQDQPRDPWGAPQSAVPPPYAQPYGGQPYGQGQPQPHQPQYSQPQYAPPGYGAPSGRDPGKRPTTVTVAAVLTWLGAGATALLMLVFVAVLGAGGDAFVEEFETAARESDVALSTDDVLAVGWAVAGTMLVWSLISIVLAILAFRRSNGARIALVVSAVMAALFSLVAIMSIVSAVTLLLAGATVILLFTGGANQWYSRRSSDGPHSGSQSGAYPGWQPGPQPDRQPGPQAGSQSGPPAGYPHGDQPQGQPTQQTPGRNKPW